MKPMSKGYFWVDAEQIKNDVCPYSGCEDNINGTCKNMIIRRRFVMDALEESFECKQAKVPDMVCDFCEAELEYVQGDKTCPEGCF